MRAIFGRISRLREPISGLTHLLGAVLAIIGAAALLQRTRSGDLAQTTALFLFAVTLFFMYLASALFHLIPGKDSVVRALQRFDHIMIFLFIAGSYTPFCLIGLRGHGGFILFCAIWSLAALGVLTKIFWFEAPRWVSTLIYVVMGWTGALAFLPIKHFMLPEAQFWLFAGGMTYTAGAFVYGFEKPNLLPPHFASHELWHLFVMGGSACHFWAVYNYLSN